MLSITDKHSGKMSGMISINTSVLDNKFCMNNNHEICQYCYAKKMEGYRPNLHNSFSKNTKLLSQSIIVPELLPYINGKLIRIHAFGELINKVHYTNIANIAKKNSHATVALWTKRPELIDINNIPENLILIYSEPALNNPSPIIPSHFHKAFAVYTNEYFEIEKQPENSVECEGKNCVACQSCYKKETSNTIIEILKGKYKPSSDSVNETITFSTYLNQSWK